MGSKKHEAKVSTPDISSDIPARKIRKRRALLSADHQWPILTFTPTKVEDSNSDGEKQYILPTLLEDSPTILESQGSDNSRSPLMKDSLAPKSLIPGDVDEIFLNFSQLLDSKNMVYEEALAKIEKGLVEAEQSSTLFKEIIADVTQVLGDALTCAICNHYMKSPTTLKCGHSLCRVCLQTWFKTIYEDALRKSEYSMGEEEKKLLENPSTDAEIMRDKMTTFAHINCLINPHYSCPSCLDELKPKQRNVFTDFKLSECINVLTAFKTAAPSSSEEYLAQGSSEEAGFDMADFF